MGFLGGAAGSGHRLQCPASLVHRLAGACGPPCRTGSIGKLKTEALTALMRKVRGHGGGGVFSVLGPLFGPAASPPMPSGVGPVIRLVRLAQHDDSVACVAKQIQP